MTLRLHSGIAPERIAAAALGVDMHAIRTIERIKHGLTNDSWRVRTATDAVIVRLSNAAEAVLQIDRVSEAIVLRAVGAVGIGPEVLVSDSAGGVLVTRDLGTTWNEEDAHLPMNISRLAQLLRSLHTLEMPQQVRRVVLLETIRGYLRTLDERGNQSPVSAEPVRLRAEHVALTLQQGAPDCLCHNDVHHLNIVDDGQLRLIDWEYSGIGEAMFDLASVCVYHRFDNREREQLLESYVSTADSAAPHRLDLACWLFEYVKDLWMEVRAKVD